MSLKVDSAGSGDFCRQTFPLLQRQASMPKFLRRWWFEIAIGVILSTAAAASAAALIRGGV